MWIALGLLFSGCTNTSKATDPDGTGAAITHLDTASSDSGTPETGSPDTDTGTPDTGTLDTGASDSGASDTGTPDTGTAASCSPAIVLRGHGDGLPEPWWIETLATLGCSGGDVGGDSALRVVVLTESAESDTSESMVEVLTLAGFDEVDIQVITSPGGLSRAAEAVQEADAAVLAVVSAADAYDGWNSTSLEDALWQLHTERGGGLGGVGEGAMLLAGISLAGGADYLSTHVMIDGYTEELDDLSDGTSALKTDFLPLVPDAIVDIEMTRLGRLTRLVGAMARSADEGPAGRVWGIGLDARAALVIQDEMAEVAGTGTVTLIRPTEASQLERARWAPLTWTHLSMDRLTAGWRFSLETGEVDTELPPEGAEAVTWDGVLPTYPETDWEVNGHLTPEESAFGTVVTRTSAHYGTAAGTDSVTLPHVLGMLDADFYETQSVNHESLYRALYDHIGHVGVLVTYQGRLEQHPGAPGELRFTWNTPVPSREDPGWLLERWEPSHVVVDSSQVQWRALGPEASAFSSAMNPAALVGLQLHILAGSDSGGWVYDLDARSPTRP
jgi:cyanophycinase-like exopeptidase